MSSNQQNNQPQGNQSNDTTSQVKSANEFNYTKWGFIVGVIGVIITGLTVTELKCFLGSCVSDDKNKEFEIITQTEAGDSLQGTLVKVTAKQGPPETKITDVNGYAKVYIPSKGDVSVNITKDGYENQNISINLKNEQSTTRTIQLIKKK
jgi:hypothetical protein